MARKGNRRAPKKRDALGELNSDFNKLTVSESGQRAARRGKKCTTNVDTGASSTAEVLVLRKVKVCTRSATRAANKAILESRRVGENNKPSTDTTLKQNPKVAVVKAAQPVTVEAPPRVAPLTVPEQPANVDIDAGDSDMPELCSEYVKDIYAYLMDQEVKQAVKPWYTEGYDITPRMRALLIDWLIMVHSGFQLLQETLYLTVAILDRFMQVHPVSRKKLQLVGVTAMLLASKYEANRRVAPRVRHFASITDNAFTPAQIRNAEREMLRALDFELGRPLPVDFLRRAAKVANATMKTYTLAKYLMELTLLDYDMVHYRPSEIAAASLCLSQMLLDGQPWTRTAQYYSTYDENHLMPIMQHICKNVVAANERRRVFRTVWSKYSGSTLMNISCLDELKSPAVESLAAWLEKN